MKQTCKFDKALDLQMHVPSLATDMKKAIETGVVSAALDVADFNHMDIEIAENASRLREPFDSIEYGFELKSAAAQFASGTGNIVSPIGPAPAPVPVPDPVD